MKRIDARILIFALLLPLAVGMISSVLSAQGMAEYGTMNKPALSPPAWVFPVAWTILYLMMGFASYLVLMADADPAGKRLPLLLYAVQLAMNFMWSLIFFRWDMYMAAFIWLMILWVIVIFCACEFGNLSKAAGLLLVPYILWLMFASYLNLGAYVLSC